MWTERGKLRLLLSAPHRVLMGLGIVVLCGVYVLTVCFPGSLGSISSYPILSAPSGFYDADLLLRIRSPQQGARVIFTLDGRVPTETVGSLYTAPLRLTASPPDVVVVRARAVSAAGQWGPVVSATYFMGVEATLPLLSLIAEPDDIWGAERGIYANPLERGDDWERPVVVTYLDKDRSNGFQIGAGLRIHGRWSRDFEKKSFRLYFRRAYGAARLAYPLFAESTAELASVLPDAVVSFDRLVLHAGGQDYNELLGTNWTLMRNELADNLALQIGGYAVHNQPALVFLNGELMGIYQIRERLDDQFLEDYLGVTSADYLQAPEHKRDQAIQMGDREHWDHLMEFLVSHDLELAEHYAYLETQVDLENFMDHTILQIYNANTDWPRHNVDQFRARVPGGRWQWIFWDSDFGFSANLDRSYVDTNMIRPIMEYDYPWTEGRDVLLLRKLLANSSFRERYLVRLADLLNTTLRPAAVRDLITTLAAELAPDIRYESLRWGSTTGWTASVQDLYDFAAGRPDFVRRQMIDQFGLEGVQSLYLEPPVEGEGTVAVNHTLVASLPWEGVYFQGLPIQVTAVPAPGYRFAGWVSPVGQASQPAIDADAPVITLTMMTALTLKPKFEAIARNALRPGDVTITQADSEGVTLYVTRRGGIDLRGWRLTDNDTKTALDEGSWLFTAHPALAHIPRGTTIVIRSEEPGAELTCPADDLGTWDRKIVLHTCNDGLDTMTDPGFCLGSRDNVVLLAPGPTASFADDTGIAFVSTSPAVTPGSFGVLVDGVR